MDSMVVCPEPLAAAVGESVYEAGGNAADAVVAAAFAQGVVNPMLCSIGGGGIMQVFDQKSGRRVVLNCEVMIGSTPPPAEWVDQYLGRAETVGRFIISSEENQVGHRSVMLPGFVRGAWALYKEFGSGNLSWNELIEPAIELGRNGYEVYPYIAAFMKASSGGDVTQGRPGYPDLEVKIAASPDAARIHLKEDGSYRVTGDWLVQTDYADTLERIATAGADDFYAGEIADVIVRDFEAHGGLLTREDFANYEVQFHDPIPSTFRGYDVSAPSMSSTGPQLIELLKILERFDLETIGHNTAEYVDLFSRVQRASFSDIVRTRCTHFEEGMRIAGEITTDERAAYWANRIGRGDRIDVFAGTVKPGTTHVTGVDRDRNAITWTHSIGSIAGSGVITPGLGFFYNNFLGQYNPIPGSPDSIEPGKRFGGGVPAIFFKDGQPVLAVGAPGGSRIITSVTQAVINALVFGMPYDEAVSVPRFHSEEDQLVLLEPAFSDEVQRALEALGNTVTRTTYMSRVQAIGITPERLVSGADPRGGAGVGYHVA